MDPLKGRRNITKKPKPLVKKKKSKRPEVSIEPVVDIQKEFINLPGDEFGGIKVSRYEKDIISSKSAQQRKQLPELEIVDIIYSLISNEELEKLAVFDAKETDDSGDFSVNDPRGGTVDKDLCSTCYLDNYECPGHLGRIVLAEKIIHPVFRREVVYILNSVCASCGGLLLPHDIIKEKGFLNLQGSDRLKAISEASKSFPCRANYKDKDEEDIKPCVTNPIYIADKLKDTGKIYYTYEKKNKNNKIDNFKTTDDIHNILKAIEKEDAEILGFVGDSHPSRFILEALPVIPLCARPFVLQDGELMKDDITSMYQNIIRINNLIKDNNPGKKLSEADKDKTVKNLIWAIDHMIDNSDKKYGQGKNKVYQSVKDRIQGKEGLIRKSLMGKRVNFSARTVIGPDPSLKFGQIRIPRAMASSLTQHEIVDPNNIETMRNLFKAGKITHYTPSDGRLAGKRIQITKKILSEYELKIGDEVDRHLQNGDWIVFNRQPTLHKQGIMGYEVVLGDPSTIGVHLGVTRQHNAD